MSIESQAMSFLAGEFPDMELSKLEDAFGWVYEKGRFGEEENAEMRRTDIAKIESVIDALRSLSSSSGPKEIRKLCNGLDSHALNHVKSDLNWETAGPAAVADGIANYKRMVEIWYQHNSVAGGRNVTADAIAKAVKFAFEEIGRPARFGNASDGKSPSTPFGRVVEDALDFHGNNAHWRRPTQNNAVKKQMDK